MFLLKDEYTIKKNQQHSTRKDMLNTRKISKIRTKFLSILISKFGKRLEERTNLVLEALAVISDFLLSNFTGGRDTAGVHNTAPVGHLVFIGILGVVVVIHGVNHAQVQQQAVQNLTSQNNEYGLYYSIVLALRWH